MTKLDGLIAAREMALTRIEEIKPETSGNYETFELERLVKTLDDAIAADRQSGEKGDIGKLQPEGMPIMPEDYTAPMSMLSTRELRTSPAAKEPRECPTPGACSCIEPLPTATDPVAGVSEGIALNALVHIAEYWNGSQTEGAMSDALQEIVSTAEIAIAALRARPNEGTFAEGIEAAAKAVVETTNKWAAPNETQYRQGARDHGNRIYRAVRSLTVPKKKGSGE